MALPSASSVVQRSSTASVAQRSSTASVAQRFSAVIALARDFSPRIETHGDRTVTLDISGLGSLIGEPRTIGEELRRAAADAGLRVHVAVAATSTAAILVAHARAGLTVVAAGDEAQAVASLPLDLLDRLAFNVAPAAPTAPSAPIAPTAPNAPIAPVLKRWGLKTLGDLAALPSSELSARLGQQGVRWQKWARGEEIRPIVPTGVAETFEESLDLEWPIEGLEPLSFVFARLLDPLCERLERRDRGAVVLRVTFKLVTRDLYERVVELPAPMRDARVLRTLALLDLESNPPSEAIDRVTIGVDVTEGRVLQFGLFARALPTDKLATLMARLGALMGSDRVGAPALVDTYRPGAFTMAKFDPPRTFTHHQSQMPALSQSQIPHHQQQTSVLRRFRSPIPARVTLDQRRPVRVTTDRRGFGGGRVERSEGPWRSSGDWWVSADAAYTHASRVAPWNSDEWDVTLHDGTTYRISHALDSDAWFVDGMVD
jgi:protein ImuB